MDSSTPALGILSILVGATASVLVALISRPRDREPEPVPALPAPAPPMPVTTVSGLAEVVAEQGREIRALADRLADRDRHAAEQDLTIRALRRYLAVVRDALVRTGTAVPDPDPEDAPYIQTG